MHAIKTHLKQHTVSYLLWLILVIILVVAVFFLRLYRLPEYLMFLSDQGRDAIVLKRLVTLEKLVFVGPTTSIGNVFTGPFYYYLVAPFMLVFGLHPVGPAIGIALINSIGLVGIVWYVTRRFGKRTALIFLILAGLSATQVWQSRYSWNPNPVPLFTFLTLIAWQQAVDTKKLRYFALTGILFGFSLQLHYITVILGVLFLVTALQNILVWMQKQKSPNPTHPKKGMFLLRGAYAYLLVAVSLVATFLPLIVFEIKNRFINTQTFLRAFSAGEVQAKNSVYLDRLRDTCAGLLQHIFLMEFNRDIALILLVTATAIVLYIVWKDKRTRAEFIVWSLIVVAANIFALSRLETGRHVHYYNPSYYLVYLIIAYVLVSVARGIKTIFVRCRTFEITGEFCDEKHPHVIHTKKAKYADAYCDACVQRAYEGYSHMEKAMLVCFTLVLIIVLFQYSRHQLASLFFLTEKPKSSTQITHAQRVAKHIIGQVTSDKFQVVGLPFYEVEGHYRYFLEYYDRRPMSSDALGDPKELFVICHELAKPDCDIPGNPQWQIADFQNRHPDWRIEDSTLVEEVRVYKLVYGENDKTH